MRKGLFLVMALLLIAALCMAQQPRNPTTFDYEGKTNYGHIGVQGQDVTGNPGYIELRGTNSVATLYYLWVNEEGKLMIASASSLTTVGFTGGSSGTRASFPSGDWRTIEDSGAADVVGSQS